VPEGDALGELQARSISSDFVVVQGTNPPSLRKGPGHYRQTALPGMGGTVGIAGHRTTYEAPFRRLDDLKRGDTITLRMPYGRFTYSVDGHRIVPSGYKDAFTGQGGERLVLSACHPLYSASQRILVSAHLVSRQPLGAAVETTAPKPTGPNARQLARQHTAAQLKALGNRTLTLGMRGSDVKELQRLLGLPATGLFGPQTRAAVIAFQTQHGIPPVGNAGSQTKRALARRQHPPSRPPTPPAVPQAQQPSHQGTSQNGTGTSTTPQTTTPNAGGAQGAPTTGTQPTQGH
jgi:LPXTG-site transpeptidase (sortase) family protein